MNTVTLHDGQQVDSSSEAWRQECEARYVLAKPHFERVEFFALIEVKRGAAAVEALKRCCMDVEPAYVLDLPNKAQRNDYLAKVEERFGHNASNGLRRRILDLHEQRRALAPQQQQSA